jgi:hypothetical protein
VEWTPVERLCLHFGASGPAPLTAGVSRAPMNKITINKRSVLRVLLGVYLFPLYLVVFSLSVPPRDLPLCGLMFTLAGVGYVLARRESRAWRLIWFSALVLSLLCGVLQVVAGQRIARQRSHHESNSANPARAVDAPIASLFAFACQRRRATDERRSAEYVPCGVVIEIK